LVPGFVARAIDTSTHPLRTARQVIEEVEEITFSLKRTRKLTVDTEESVGTRRARRSAPITSEDARDDGDFGVHHAASQPLSPHRVSAKPVDDIYLASGRRESKRELTERDAPAQLRGNDGPRQLPPAE
jgi:hypothetical protein